MLNKARAVAEAASVVDIAVTRRCHPTAVDATPAGLGPKASCFRSRWGIYCGLDFWLGLAWLSLAWLSLA
jgi:hypothetical protein